jgi:hypothetical protein
LDSAILSRTTEIHDSRGLYFTPYSYRLRLVESSGQYWVFADVVWQKQHLLI